MGVIFISEHDLRLVLVLYLRSFSRDVAHHLVIGLHYLPVSVSLHASVDVQRLQSIFSILWLVAHTHIENVIHGSGVVSVCFSDRNIVLSWHAHDMRAGAAQSLRLATDFAPWLGTINIACVHI